MKGALFVLTALSGLGVVAMTALPTNLPSGLPQQMGTATFVVPATPNQNAVSTLQVAIAAATYQAGQTATAVQATQSQQQWAATREVAQITLTAAQGQANATGTAQIVGGTLTAVPLQQTQLAHASTALAATAQSVTATAAAVRVTFAYSESVMQATATQHARVIQMRADAESAERARLFWNGAFWLLGLASLLGIVGVGAWLWHFRTIPAAWAGARIARMKVVQTSAGPIVLGQGDAAPRDAAPAAETPRPDGDVAHAEAAPAPSPARDPHAARPPEQREALAFLDVCYAFASQTPNWPTNMLPDYRRLKHWHAQQGHATQPYSTGADWQTARNRFGDALVGVPGTGTKVAPEWGTISGLYNAVQQGKVELQAPE